MLELRGEEITALVRRGLLAPGDQMTTTPPRCSFLTHKTVKCGLPSLMSKKSASATSDQIRTRRAAAAERMRRSRRRHGKGMHCYMLELRDEEITALVRRGLLAPGDQTNRAAVVKAMYEFLDRTIWGPT